MEFKLNGQFCRNFFPLLFPLFLFPIQGGHWFTSDLNEVYLIKISIKTNKPGLNHFQPIFKNAVRILFQIVWLFDFRLLWCFERCRVGGVSGGVPLQNKLRKAMLVCTVNNPCLCLKQVDNESKVELYSQIGYPSQALSAFDSLWLPDFEMESKQEVCDLYVVSFENTIF